MKEYRRHIREPIHRYVRLTTIENRIVDSPYFARLAQVSQMHSAHLVYPSATYARKVHCLGAMHIASRAVSHILAQQHWPFVDEEHRPHALLSMEHPPSRPWTRQKLKPLNLREALKVAGVSVENDFLAGVFVLQAMRLAALLHDIGHAPLSHLYESASRDEAANARYNHEIMSGRIIRQELTKPPPGGGEPLLDKQDAEFVASILDKSLQSSKLEFLHDLITGALDVDKLDYLLRDAHATGTVEYGTVDLDRIIDTLVVHDGRLCYASTGLDAVIQALNAMFFMYNNVYLHDTVRGFDLAALEGLQPLHATLRAYQDGVPQLPDGKPAREFVDLDDATFLAMIERVAESERAKGQPGPYDAAYAALEQLRRRRMTFRAVIDARLAVPMSAAPAYKDIIQKLRADLEVYRKEAVEYAHLQDNDIRLDLDKNIRPIGVGLEDITEFLTGDFIFDTKTGDPVAFSAYQPHYKTLTRIVVPIRFYVRDPRVLPSATEQTLRDKVTARIKKEQDRLIGQGN